MTAGLAGPPVDCGSNRGDVTITLAFASPPSGRSQTELNSPARRRSLYSVLGRSFFSIIGGFQACEDE